MTLERPRDEAFRLDDHDPQPGHRTPPSGTPQAKRTQCCRPRAGCRWPVLAGIGERLAPACRSCSATAPTQAAGWHGSKPGACSCRNWRRWWGAPQLRQERGGPGPGAAADAGRVERRSRPLRCRTAWPGLQCRRAGQPGGAEAPAGPAGRARAAAGPQRAAGHRVTEARQAFARVVVHVDAAPASPARNATRWPGSCCCCWRVRWCWCPSAWPCPAANGLCFHCRAASADAGFRPLAAAAPARRPRAA
jgi:hypothetical protein